MPAELASSIPQVIALVEKGGVIGLLLLYSCVLTWALIKGRAEYKKEIASVYRQRDRWRLAFTIVKGAADHAGASLGRRSASRRADSVGAP